MKTHVLLSMLILVGPALSGCFGASADEIDFDFEPGTNFKETGKTVEIKMWVADIIQKEIWPGFFVDFWAFCAAASDPADDYSVNAIEYQVEGEECSVPGPQLRVQQGDRVIVHFENPHLHYHTIHWHGQYVPHASDGVQGVNQDSVPPEGGKYTYDFIAKRAGTLWYHCHVDTPFHIMMGLYGVIIVEPQDTTWEPKDIDKEYTIVLSTAIQEHVESPDPAVDPDYNPHAVRHDHSVGCGASGKINCQNPAVTDELDIFMINGESAPFTFEDDKSLIVIKPDERVRIRLVNSGGTFETFHTHGHDMYVTHRDGNPLHPHARFYVDTLTIGPGERYDFVLEGRADAAEGAWVAHTHVEEHITNDHQAPGGMLTMIVYEGFEDNLRPYKAELPGGGPSRFPTPVPPADFDLHDFVNIQGSHEEDNVDESWEIPIDLCFTDAVRLYADLHTDAVGDRTNTLTFHLLSPAGQEVIGTDLTRNNPTVTWYPEYADLVGGNYTATVTGSAATSVSLGITASVTHLASFEDAEELRRPCDDA